MASRRLRSAVVLAAGQGSRIWPYGVVRQKAAFPIGNVPVVRRLVEDLAALGIERIVVVVGHGEASVRAGAAAAVATSAASSSTTSELQAAAGSS